MKTKRYHNIVDMAGCNEKIADSEAVRAFILELVEKVKMHVLAGPLVEEGIPENPGVSAILIIDYSHISIHTFTDNREALIDIFSCKPYDKEVVSKFCKEYFSGSDTVVREKEVWWGK